MQGRSLLITDKLALLLAGYLLAGCVHAARDTTPAGDTTAVQRPARVIVYLNQAPAADSKQLAAAVAEACSCHPVFFRQFGSNALIYEIILPGNHSFASFEKALRAGRMSREIQAVEEDLLMRHQ